MPDAHTAPRFAIHAAIGAFLAAALVQAACGSSGNTFTAPSSLSKCAVTTETSGSTLPAAGGTASITVTTERECQWTASPDGAWLKVTAGASGQGPGTVQLAAAANADPVTRTAAVVVNNQRVQIAQEAAECRVDLSARSASFPPAGGTGSVDVRASSPLCTWAASSDVAWITITSGANGKGSAPVSFNVSPTSGLPRTGTMQIAGVSFTVEQSDGCAYAIAPATYAAVSDGGSTAVTVSAGPGCPWTATSNASWISISTPAGSGPGTVGITVAPLAGPMRTGTATIAGQTFSVTQSPGCTFALSPSSQNVSNAGGTASVVVTAPDGCAWTAASNASWISIASGSGGSGNGTVQLVVASNADADRTGTATIAGQTFTIVQSAGCTYSLSPSSQQVAAAGGSGSFVVNAGGTCAWIATASVAWISVTSTPTGQGTGTVQFTAAANSGGARTGTIAVAGQAFTVNQDAGCTATVSPDTIAAPAAGGSQNVQISIAAECSWTSTSNAPWISVTSGAGGAGNGTAQLAIAANIGPARTGTVTIATRGVTVNQASGCTFSISPSSQSMPAQGGNGVVTVTAGDGCTWTGVSNVNWITVTAGATGTGNGSVQFTVDLNDKKNPRTGTITIAGQEFTVNQAEATR